MEISSKVAPLLSTVGFALAAYIGVLLAHSRLRPSFWKLERAATKGAADEVIDRWKQNHLRRYLLLGIVIEGFFYMTVGAVAWETLSLVMEPSIPDWVEGLIFAGIGMAFFATAAGAFENAVILWSVFFDRDARWTIRATRFAASIKFLLVSMVVLTALFGVMAATRALFDPMIRQNPRTTTGWLVVVTLAALLLFARYATRLSSQRPPLLSLQIAPTRVGAKVVMERWGKSGRRLALRALMYDVLLAMCYGITLATICERLPLGAETNTWLAWGILVVAAAHIAQNFGAMASVRFVTLGWWWRPMRLMGWGRLFGLFAVLMLFAGRFLWAEYEFVRAYVVRINPKDFTPWR